MFGIKHKKSDIIALIFGICGIIILALKVFKVLEDDSLYTLLSLVLMLFAFSLYLRPKMKYMKVYAEVLGKYREKLYTEITKECKRSIEVRKVEFIEDDNGIMHCKDLSFEGLTLEEFKKVVMDLLNDFCKVCYAMDYEKIKEAKTKEEKKELKIKSKIDEFKIMIFFNNDKVVEKYLIKDYKFVK